jgi:membrane protein implicated in regulation of membrane protease activity
MARHDWPRIGKLLDMFADTWFWIGLGLALCVLELIFPTAFVELVMGLSAILVAFVSLLVPSFGVQVFIWMLVSLVSIFLVRRFLPRRMPKILEESLDATTLTAIAPGEKGRVLHEGSPWAARCEDRTMAIAPQTKVTVVGREGTTLVVMPKQGAVDSSIYETED